MAVKSTLKPPVIPRRYQKLLSPRPGFFDNGSITIQKVFKLAAKYFVYYHVRPRPGEYHVGQAVFDRQLRLLERSTTPIWSSPWEWQGREVTLIGVVKFGGQDMSFWDLGSHEVYSVVYPVFKLRQPVFRSISPRLERVENNPLIQPSGKNWESSQTFNPTVVRLDGRFHFLYRAVGDDGVSRLGYAVSEDGRFINYRHPDPVFSHSLANSKFTPQYFYNPSGGSWGGAEDPRIVQVGQEDRLYMTYTAFIDRPRVGFSSISVSDFVNGRFNWTPPIIISPPGQTHKNWVIFPEKIHGQYAILHAITPHLMIEYFDDLNFDGRTVIDHSIDPQLAPPVNSAWDRRLRGAGCPPIKTEHGWLMFYHSMDYKVGAMLLDLSDPTKIIYRARSPILESLASYENQGNKPGIVYVSGAVVKDGKLFVYYGSADNYVCLATADLDQFLSDLKSDPPQVLESAIINKII